MFLRKDPLKRARLPEITSGANVFTADDASIGTVAEVGEVSFKVDVPRAPDIWLGRDYVTDATAERVSMSFERREIDAYKLGQPGLDAEKDTTQEALVDAAVPREQQREQRLRMEQQLAEQRQQLPHTHPEGSQYTPPDTGGTVGEPVEEELRSYGVDPMRDAALSAERGHDVEELTDTGSLADEGRASTQRSDPPEFQMADSRSGEFEYSVPTRSADYDPAAKRRRIAGGTVGAVAAVSLAGLGFLWMMRRRRNHTLDRRAKDAASQAAGVVKDAARRGYDGAREAFESARD
ncbi:MAG: transmembrane domain-containing protein [Dehalococcoidia bacterium]